MSQWALNEGREAQIDSSLRITTEHGLIYISMELFQILKQLEIWLQVRLDWQCEGNREMENVPLTFTRSPFQSPARSLISLVVAVVQYLSEIRSGDGGNR